MSTIAARSRFAEEPRPQKRGNAAKDDITFSEFLKHYVKVYGTSKWSMSTYSGKTGLIRNYIDPYIGDKKLSEITTECLSEYYNDLLSVERVPPANQKRPANVSRLPA